MNKKPGFLRIALPTPLGRLFDYLPPQDIDTTVLKPGVRVRVPFQSRKLTGILIEVTKESSVPYGKLKHAIEILDDAPIFPDDIYQLCQWAASYYHYALGEVLSAAMPVPLRKGLAAQIKPKAVKMVEAVTVPLMLNQAQQSAVDAITQSFNKFQPFLLEGVTGSGKTEVYLQAIDKILQAGKQALILVPEISLTPQTVERFRARFAVPVVALHSSFSEQQRLRGWLAARSGEAKIIIGTRSAIFTPFAELGLIIVDEEHDGSFKQQDRFRYHARDLSVMRANINQIPVVLGSATPSLESLFNVQRGRYQLLQLPERAGDAALPEFHLVDLRSGAVEEGLSATLLHTMRDHLDRGNQVMLFLNRRGFAPVLYCAECQWIAECKRCDARMVYHRKPARLQCHHCDSRSAIPINCGNCRSTEIRPIGLGTQRLEEILAQHFPDVPIVRVDRDTTRRKGAMEALLQDIHQQPRAILLGTQMLAKGHHFPNVTLVGIIDADSGLFSADFRAAEQMGQLLLQVSGRAGREDKAGTVMVQTRHPEHPLLQLLIHQGYTSFSQSLLDEREKAALPPYTYFALFRAEAYADKTAQQFLENVKQLCANAASVSVLGPVSALMARKKGLHCQHLIIKAKGRAHLQQFLTSLLEKIEQLPTENSVKWILDVDPMECV